MNLAEEVAKAVDTAPVFDLHTHLFPPQSDSLNRWGIDELLTYHYLVAEVLRAEPKTSPEAFYSMDRPAQANFVWHSLFVRRSPLSEATSGILTVLDAFGLNPQTESLDEIRDFFDAKSPEDHLQEVLRLAGVSSLTMTNDPWDKSEWEYWDRTTEFDECFLPALRLDRIIESSDLKEQLKRWIPIVKPRYLAVSVNEIQAPPSDVLNACREYNLPFALMIGVRRGVNPRLGEAGDGMSIADLSPIERLAAENPDTRFLITTLARENTHGVCVIARKFANVLPFGCWWFMNNPSLVEETTLLRLEMLGPTFVPQHSDARILEQLIYKWRHTRRAISNVLVRRYEELPYQPSEEQIRKDAESLMGGIAREWIG